MLYYDSIVIMDCRVLFVNSNHAMNATFYASTIDGPYKKHAHADRSKQSFPQYFYLIFYWSVKLNSLIQEVWLGCKP